MTSIRLHLYKLRRDRRAVSPAISTTILTSAIVVLLLVTIVFANNFLNSRMAENEFSAMKQSMQTVGLQIDDVAWTIGRTQTLRYASKYGQVNFESVALNYTVYVNNGGGYVYFANYSVGMLMFNVHASKYSLGNNYYERIFPSSNSSFLQKGASAPVGYVYIIEKMPMNDGNFIRIVVVPSIRILDPIGGGENYSRLYLPVLKQGSNPRYSQSITLEGSCVSAQSSENCVAVKISATFPKAGLGFNADFFKFANTEEIVNLNGRSIVFYTGDIVVSLGLYV